MSDPDVAIELTRAVPNDIDTMLTTVHAGFDSYVDFAPEGWTPPVFEDERKRAEDLLAEADTWVTLAVAGGAAVGHVGFVPARVRAIGEPPGDWRGRPPLAGVAHLWQLFVLPAWWGTGVAATLHAAAVDEMRTQGYELARLYTPAGHARACRFYERRGWSLIERGMDETVGLELAEYQLELS